MSKSQNNQKLLERVLKGGEMVLTVFVDRTGIIDGSIPKTIWMLDLRSEDNKSKEPNADGAGTTYKQALGDLCRAIKCWENYEQDYGNR